MSLRVAVIGAGSMGMSHARVYSKLESVELVGVADKDESRAHEVARHFRTRAYTDHESLIHHERPEAVSVAVPTTLHAAVACDCLEARIHTLVEKPVASTPLEVRRMISVATEARVKLFVGHIERFNPAIRELKRRVCGGQLGKVFQIHATRLGPFPARIRDVGVVVDLATHDIDVMHFLLDARPTRAYAETERKIHTDHEDLFSGVLKFPGGTIGVLETNWLTPTKMRELRVTGERGMLVARYLEQDLYLYKNQSSWRGWTPGGTNVVSVSEGTAMKVNVERGESLDFELRSFIDCITQDGDPMVTAEDGLAALLVADALVRSGVDGRVVDLTPVLVG